MEKAAGLPEDTPAAPAEEAPPAADVPAAVEPEAEPEGPKEIERVYLLGQHHVMLISSIACCAIWSPRAVLTLLHKAFVVEQDFDVQDCLQEEMTLEEYEAAVAEKRSQFRKQPTKATSNKEDFSGNCLSACSTKGCMRFTRVHIASLNLLSISAISFYTTARDPGTGSLLQAGACPPSDVVGRLLCAARSSYALRCRHESF